MANHFLRRAVATVAKGVDRAFAGTALTPPRGLRRKSSAESLGHAERMRGLSAIASFYNREEFQARPSLLFPAASAIAPSTQRVRKLGTTGEVLDLSWPSNFAPLWTLDSVAEHFGSLPADAREKLGMNGDASAARIMGEFGIDKNGSLADKYLRSKRNQIAHARWYHHESGDRPCVVLVHGYMTGTYAFEERVWPVQQLFESGLDVVMTVLPFHGPRRSEERGLLPPAFPSGDPRFTIEGLRQLVLDHTGLFDYLLDGRVSSLGVMGMSLGGYSSALLATLDPRLDFLVLFIPLAAIEDFARTHGRFVGDDEQKELQRGALRTAQWQVSPLSRPPLVKGDRVVVLAGESDLVTGLEHGQRLSKHFETEMSTFEGGHLLQFGRGRAFAPVWSMLERAGRLERGPFSAR